MRDAHTLLLSKQMICEARSKSPQPALNEFINYTDVSEYITDMQKPIKAELPLLREMLAGQNKKIQGLVMLTKSMQKEL